MLIWLIYAPIAFLVSLVCYITNPIVVLFCDEDGELPCPLSLWQTWDNSCNPSDLKRIAPPWLQFDFDKHYRERYGTDELLHQLGRSRWYTDCIDDDFTLVERLKRYACRVIWLTRNCGYGYAFYFCGISSIGTEYTVYHRSKDYTLAVNLNDWLLLPFIYKDDRKWFSIGNYDIYKCFFFGWKVDLDCNIRQQSIVAFRPTIRIRKRDKNE